MLFESVDQGRREDRLHIFLGLEQVTDLFYDNYSELRLDFDKVFVVLEGNIASHDLCIEERESLVEQIVQRRVNRVQILEDENDLVGRVVLDLLQIRSVVVFGQSVLLETASSEDDHVFQRPFCY